MRTRPDVSQPLRPARHLHATCPVCAVRFERDSGSWLGASVMTYGAAVVVLLLLGLLLIPRYGLFPGLEWVMVGGAVATVLLTYRPLKGWWVWWMWAAGFVVRDLATRDGDPGSAPQIDAVDGRSDR